MVLSLLIFFSLLHPLELSQDLGMVESILFRLTFLGSLLDVALFSEIGVHLFGNSLVVVLSFLLTFVKEVFVVPSDGCPFILLLDELELDVGSVPLGIFHLLQLSTFLLELKLLFGLDLAVLVLKLVIVCGTRHSGDS